MLNKIISTLTAKFITGVLNLTIIIVTAQVLGAEGRGIISLFILNIVIILMFNNFVGGAALVYLVPRVNLFQLLIPSYLWAIFIAFTVTISLSTINMVPSHFKVDLLVLSLIYSFTSINSSILLGKQKINKHNVITLVQVTILLLSFLVYIFLLEKTDVSSYIISLYFAYVISFVLSFVFVLRDTGSLDKIFIGQIIGKMFRHGFFVQLGNILQLFNYRLSYYLLEFFYGTAHLGIYSTGVSLAEAFWLISRSISMVQYTRISNSKDAEYSRSITIQLIKLSFVTTILILTPVLLLPSSVYTYLLGVEFGDVRIVILCLSPGIAMFSISGMFSHFFSGTGKFHINTIASGIGFIVTVTFGLLLIPDYHIVGAGITATLSYLSIGIYQFLEFTWSTNTKIKEFLPSSKDYKVITREIRKYLKEDM